MKRPQRLKPRGLENTRQILVESMKEQTPYETMVCGRTFIVHPNVFSPKYFQDTEYFAQSIKVKPGETFCEIGPGTGAISVTVAMAGANRVVAIDINQAAVANTKENIRLHHVKQIVTVYEGDVYSPLEPDNQFDTIFWNVPFGFVEEDGRLTDLEKAVFDTEYRSIEKFIRGAKNHLKPNGRLLIGFSTTLGHLSLIEELLAEEGFSKPHRLAETWSVETERVKFNLYEARRKTSP